MSAQDKTKTPAKPASLDEFLDESSSEINISADALRDLHKLDMAMRKEAGEQVLDIDCGKPVRVVMFTAQTICKSCGTVYEHPEFQAAMLKRVFRGSTLRAIYTPLTSRNLYTDLPHETELRTQHIFNCPKCFAVPDAFALGPLPRSEQLQHCPYCHGNHDIAHCPAEGRKEYAQELAKERKLTARILALLPQVPLLTFQGAQQ